MKLKKIFTELGGFVARGFRYERFDYSHLESSLGLLDYCVVIRLVPVGFRWKEVRMVVSGPVCATGTLDLFSRHVRKVGTTRYTVNYRSTPKSDDGIVNFGVPVSNESADIGIIGVYYTLEDGTTHNYITRRPVTVTRGKVLAINVPAPQSDLAGEKRAYEKPTVKVLEGEEAETIKNQLS